MLISDIQKGATKMLENPSLHTVCHTVCGLSWKLRRGRGCIKKEKEKALESKRNQYGSVGTRPITFN